MSDLQLSIHRVTAATAKVQHAGKSHWLDLCFTDAAGSTLELTLFCADPEALLSALCQRETATGGAA